MTLVNNNNAAQTSIVVDNNCYLRLLFWDQRPLLGRVVSGFKLVTTAELANEMLFSKSLLERHPWLKDPAIRADLQAAVVAPARGVRRRIDRERDDFAQAAQPMLQKYCQDAGLFPVKALSRADAGAWAAAVCLNGALATDEWPLRMVSARIEMDDAGNKLKVFSTLDLLHLLEQDGQLQAEERRNLMRQWRVYGEGLHREADADYWRLFNEAPPHAQS